MSIIILVQTCIPCADVHACLKVNEGRNEVITKTPVDNQDTHSDICSPFCQCSCCSCAAVAPKAKELALPYLIYPETNYFQYTADEPNKISLPVWQPPQ